MSSVLFVSSKNNADNGMEKICQPQNPFSEYREAISTRVGTLKRRGNLVLPDIMCITIIDYYWFIYYGCMIIYPGLRFWLVWMISVKKLTVPVEVDNKSIKPM